MLIIGVTGGIASGKTTFCQMLREKGATIIEGDEVGRQVVENDPSILSRLVEIFGDQIVEADGSLSRRRLGQVAFSDGRSRDELNRIVHPPLLAEMNRRIDELKRSGYGGLVVIDAALLVEWGLPFQLDCLIVVEASEENRIGRLVEKSGYDRREARDRMSAQLSQENRRAMADYIVHNDDDMASLRREAERIWRYLVPRSSLEPVD